MKMEAFFKALQEKEVQNRYPYYNRFYSLRQKKINSISWTASIPINYLQVGFLLIAGTISL